MTDELRIGGRAKALTIVLKAAASSGAAAPIHAAEQALGGIGHQVAISQPLPECPEAWLEGMHDIEQALREAIALLGGVAQR